MKFQSIAFVDGLSATSAFSCITETVCWPKSWPHNVCQMKVNVASV